MDQQPASQIKRLLGIISTMLLMYAAPALYAEESLRLPPLHQASYSIEKYATQIGEMHTRLTSSDNGFIYQSTTSATGFVALFSSDDLVETSVLVQPAGDQQHLIQQREFTSSQGRKHRKNQKITFSPTDAQHVSISGVYKKRSYQLDTVAPVWGRHMLPLLMSSNLQQSPSSQQAGFTITDRGRLYQYNYTFLKKEKLRLSDKQIPVIKFKISRKGSDRFSYVWLSENHNYLPVKIDQHKDGELHISMLLTKYRRI